MTGSPLAASLDRLLAGLPEPSRALALSRSPAGGLPEARELWRARQRRAVPGEVASSLPFAVSGLSHGLSLAADLFVRARTPVVVPQPFWGNYAQAFGVRRGARMVPAPSFVEGRFDPESLGRALAALPEGEPALAILNFPSNPGGYSPSVEEREVLIGSLLAAAEERPLVVLCDDAYAGLVFEPEIPAGSLYWDLAGRHPNLTAVKIDGATKEFSFFGGRIGFLTFACEPGSPAAKALEARLARWALSGVGPTSAASQAVLLEALRSPGVEDRIAAIRGTLAGRYRALSGALAAADPAVLTAFPFNSGCFALVEVPEGLGLSSDQVRRRLLAEESVGLISIEPRSLRIAHCSVAAGDLPELVRRLERGIAGAAA